MAQRYWKQIIKLKLDGMDGTLLKKWVVWVQYPLLITENEIVHCIQKLHSLVLNPKPERREREGVQDDHP